jgi:hypothetical protein
MLRTVLLATAVAVVFSNLLASLLFKSNRADLTVDQRAAVALVASNSSQSKESEEQSTSMPPQSETEDTAAASTKSQSRHGPEVEARIEEQQTETNLGSDPVPASVSVESSGVVGESRSADGSIKIEKVALKSSRPPSGAIKTSRVVNSPLPVSVESTHHPTVEETVRTRKRNRSWRVTRPAQRRQSVEVAIPSGTSLEVELLSRLDTSLSRAGDIVRARTVSPVYIGDQMVVSKGTYLEGMVLEAQSSRRVKGRAYLSLIFHRLKMAHGVKEIKASFANEKTDPGRKRDAAIIGSGAGIGALVGGILGGKRGAAIGTAVGGAGGTGVALATRGEEIRLPVGTTIKVRLEDTVIVPVDR